MKNLTRRKMVFFALGFVTILLVGLTIVLLIIKPRGVKTSTQIVGEAEAVMTVKAATFDGIWNDKRYTDELYCPIGIELISGNLVVADSMCDRIQIFDGKKNQRIGKPGLYGRSYLEAGALVDGYRENALFMKPSDIAARKNGDIIICDTGNHSIRKMDADVVVTVAGNGKSGYIDGKEGKARFNAPRSVAVDKNDDIYVADTMNHCIRRIDAEGNVTTYAGISMQSGYTDGELTHAEFNEPSGLFFSPDGALYVADSANHCIRKIANGVVTTVAGAPGKTDRKTNYPEGGYVDGDNAIARFNFPRDVSMLSDGSLIVADSMNNAVRMITDKDTRTLLGNGMPDRYYGSAENLKLTKPEGVCADDKNLYISDTLNNRVVSVPLTNRILEGRPSREQMLINTGIATDSKYDYGGDIRVYLDNKKVDMGRVQPWNTPECVYVPIRPLLEALGAVVTLNETTGVLTVSINGQKTLLSLDKDYFILKGTAVTTTDEIARLLPYTIEWYPEFSLIALHIPSDLVQKDRRSAKN